VGVHPCSTTQIDAHPAGAAGYFSQLETFTLASISTGKVSAFGELGLDYDRLSFSPAATQRRHFRAQLAIAARIQTLPLFLHSRAAGADFAGLVAEVIQQLPKKGVVHSFTGTREEMWGLVGMGLDIGVNGCSMKTEENVAVVKEIPLDHLQFETDGPWVRIPPCTQTHLLRLLTPTHK
jgi:TatD DNase family protein